MKTISVPDMACKMCVVNITKALDGAGIEHSEVLLESKSVEVAEDGAEKALKAIKELGFTPEIN